ncbi:hypothetical protein FRACA_920003 [Frankia canadensis]|uniref:Uncharacterized protein n=1 Tax=Frankia canadensis TaxID=1836972 RepID=A0A2I2L2G0_9ACTN|nr:hypothetical protein FRACA_920003 [Frankia canadensis]SOU59400.1 hypothetical protein FRACA_920003 [Frankia canadensis]
MREGAVERPGIPSKASSSGLSISADQHRRAARLSRVPVPSPRLFTSRYRSSNAVGPFPYAGQPDTENFLRRLAPSC